MSRFPDMAITLPWGIDSVQGGLKSKKRPIIKAGLIQPFPSMIHQLSFLPDPLPSAPRASQAQTAPPASYSLRACTTDNGLGNDSFDDRSLAELGRVGDLEPTAVPKIPTNSHPVSSTNPVKCVNDVQSHPGQHPLPHGTLVISPGAHFNYRIVGPCCRLFDREELPWPCCRLQWRGKEPSWRRIGRRFVPDLAVKNSPSYGVVILEAGQSSEPVVMTFYHEKLSPAVQAWWYSRHGNEADRA